MSLSRRTVLTGMGAAGLVPMLGKSALAQTQAPINMAWIRQLAVSSVVQKQANLAAANGFPVELINFNRGLDGMVALQRGDVVASNCLVGYAQFFIALTQGIDLTLVAGACSRLNEIVVSPSILAQADIDSRNLAFSGEKPWEVLRGKKVGTARGSYQEFVLRSFLKSNSMDIDKDIVFVDVKTNADQALALQQKAVDAIVSVEPSAAQTRLDGYGILLSFGYNPGDFLALNNLMLVRTDLIKERPDAVQELVRSQVEAIDGYKADKAAWIKDTAEVTLFNNDTLTHLFDPESLGLDPRYWANVGIDWQLPRENIKQLASELYKVGFITTDITDQIDDRLDYSFLEKATGRPIAELGG